MQLKDNRIKGLILNVEPLSSMLLLFKCLLNSAWNIAYFNIPPIWKWLWDGSIFFLESSIKKKKKKSLHYLAFALRVIIPRQHHHLRNLSSVVSFEQCISVIDYKSISLGWYITPKMRTSGKNESGNKFSVIGFIRGYKPGCFYL